MPWRTIEASSTTGPPSTEAPNDAPRPRISRGAVAALGVAALLALGAFVIAFGSGASRSGQRRGRHAARWPGVDWTGCER